VLKRVSIRLVIAKKLSRVSSSAREFLQMLANRGDCYRIGARMRFAELWSALRPRNAFDTRRRGSVPNPGITSQMTLDDSTHGTLRCVLKAARGRAALQSAAHKIQSHRSPNQPLRRVQQLRSRLCDVVLSAASTAVFRFVGLICVLAVCGAAFGGELNEKQAVKKVFALPEFSAFEKQVRAAGHRATVGEGDLITDPKAVPEKVGVPVWRFHVYESRPDHKSRWQTFLVHAKTGKMFVYDLAEDAYLTLAEWRKARGKSERKTTPASGAISSR
jgi:hypothetical protein